MSYLGTADKYVPRKSKREILAAVEANASHRLNLPHEAFAITGSKMIARNTMEYSIEYVNGRKANRVRLHGTDVYELQYAKSGKSSRVILSSGGWKTPTTKERINNALAPLATRMVKSSYDGSEYQRTAWYVDSVNGHWMIWTPVGSFDFVDGAAFYISGKPVNPSVHNKATKQQAADEKLIRAYLAEITKHGVPAYSESGGDPFFPPDKTGKYPANDMREWLKEKYVFLTLILNAIRWAGHGKGPQGIAFYTAYLCGMRDSNMRGKLDKRHLGMVRKYIRACLGYAT